MDTIHIDLTVRCGSIQIGPEEYYDIYTWIGDSDVVGEQFVAIRMGWA